MLKEFATFIAVARDGTFTGAGQRLGLTQSAVSAQIKRLEEYLGAPLFARTPKSVQLNAYGRDVLPQAEAALALVDRMGAGEERAPRSGLLRLGAITSAQQDIVVAAMRMLRDTHPDVRVRVLPGVSLSLLGQVDAGEIDLAVAILPPFALPPELYWTPLLSEPIGLAMPAHLGDMPWREALATQAFVRYDKASFGGRLVDMFLRRHRITVMESVELDDIDAIGNMVRQGLGVALMPRTARLDMTGIGWSTLDELAFEREIGIVGRKRDDDQGLAATFAKCLVAAARQR